MIERPKRSVTRFFIPLIDVLILLFCIFLLMPFMSQPGSAESSGKQPEEKKEMTPEEMKREIAGLRFDLQAKENALRKLKEERINPAEKVSVCIMEIDGDTGTLFHYRDGKRIDIVEQRIAQDVIDEQKRRSDISRDPLFLILLPHKAKPGAIKYDKLVEYKRKWFEGVPLKFENTHNHEVP